MRAVDALLIDRAAAEWKKAIASVDLSDSVLYQLATERDEDASRVTLTSEIATDFVTSTEPPIAASGADSVDRPNGRGDVRRLQPSAFWPAPSVWQSRSDESADHVNL